MENKTYTISNLTKEELKLILESLLYTSSVDVTGNYDESFCKNFYDIALNIRLKNPDVILENLEVFNPDNIKFSDAITHDIIKTFPEVVVEDINV
jgi:hypothetical protein